MDVEVEKLVLEEFAATGEPFSAEDVYAHTSGPADIDMYNALARLVWLGSIADIGDKEGDHSQMKYIGVCAWT